MMMLWRRRRLILSLTLCLVIVLFATVALRTYVRSSGFTPSTLQAPGTASAHFTYLFSLTSFPAEVQVGQQITLRWEPSYQARGSTTDAATVPLPVRCTFDLYGPYRSLAAASQAMDAMDPFSGHPTTKPAFSAPPLTLSDWESQPERVDIGLPITLRPGFYAVVARSVRYGDGSSSGTGFPAQVVS